VYFVTGLLVNRRQYSKINRICVFQLNVLLGHVVMTSGARPSLEVWVMTDAQPHSVTSF